MTKQTLSAPNNYGVCQGVQGPMQVPACSQLGEEFSSLCTDVVAAHGLFILGFAQELFIFQATP